MSSLPKVGSGGIAALAFSGGALMKMSLLGAVVLSVAVSMAVLVIAVAVLFALRLVLRSTTEIEISSTPQGATKIRFRSRRSTVSRSSRFRGWGAKRR